MPKWPASLPQEFERTGFRDELPDRLRRSDIPNGEPVLRQTARRGREAPLSGRITMETDEYETFDKFYEDDLKDGTLAFDFPDPDNAGETILVCFRSPPALTTVGGELHRVRLALQRKR